METDRTRSGSPAPGPEAGGRVPRVVVTGATGLIGGALVKRLLGGGHVYALGRVPPKERGLPEGPGLGITLDEDRVRFFQRDGLRKTVSLAT